VVEETVFPFLDLAIVNTHILHCKKYKHNLKLNQFTKKVAEDLLSDTRSKIVERCPANSADIVLGIEHFAHKIPAKE
jgi:hypothetical protein